MDSMWRPDGAFGRVIGAVDAQKVAYTRHQKDRARPSRTARPKLHFAESETLRVVHPSDLSTAAMRARPFASLSAASLAASKRELAPTSPGGGDAGLGAWSQRRKPAAPGGLLHSTSSGTLASAAASPSSVRRIALGASMASTAPDGWRSRNSFLQLKDLVVGPGSTGAMRRCNTSPGAPPSRGGGMSFSDSLQRPQTVGGAAATGRPGDAARPRPAASKPRAQAPKLSKEPAPPALEVLSAALGHQPDPDALQRYLKCGGIREALESGAVALLKGSWLVELAERPKRNDKLPVLPPREKIPPDAFWQADALLEGSERVRQGHEIVAVSHCWLSAAHPDPSGEQLEKLARFLKAWNNHRTGLLLQRVAVYLDFCSEPQRRRLEEEKLHAQRARSFADMWFAHDLTHVLQLTAVPRVGGEVPTPYQGRGWTTFEQALPFINPTRKGTVLDVGRCETGASYQERGWPSDVTAMNVLIQHNTNSLDAHTMAGCIVPQRPPMAPKRFAAQLETKKFSIRSDLEALTQQYEAAFQAITSSLPIRRLELSSLQWEDMQVDWLAEALPSFKFLEELNLSDNLITDSGAGTLAEWISGCPSLQKIFLPGNEVEFGFMGAEELLEGWKAAGKDDFWLMLSYPEHSDFVRRKADL